MDFYALCKMFRSGKDPFDISILELSRLVVYHFFYIVRTNKIRKLLKRSSQITIFVTLYYKIDNKYIGKAPFIEKMDSKGVVTLGEPIVIPVTNIVRHVIN